MITGEHAVLFGHPAIVCAIEQRISVHFTMRPDRMVKVCSDKFDPVQVPIDDARAEGPLRFVLGCIEQFGDRLSRGFDIKITSEIEPNLGLGSSAAVTAATLAGLTAFVNQGEIVETGACKAGFTLPAPDTLHRDAVDIVRKIQGRGSGADLAASIFGGVLAYHLSGAENKEIVVAPLPGLPEMGLRYCGYKTPTAIVLDRIAHRMKGNEPKFHDIFQRMGSAAGKTIEAVRQQHWDMFFRQIDEYQSLMTELGVSDAVLERLIKTARLQRGVRAAKISGSGMGDCILSFGGCPGNHSSVRPASTGVRIEEAR